MCFQPSARLTVPVGFTHDFFSVIGKFAKKSIPVMERGNQSRMLSCSMKGQGKR